MSNAAGWCPYCFYPLSDDYSCGWCSVDPPEIQSLDLPIGTVVGGQYIIGRVLGRGGFGITYLAWQMGPERHVALKEYFPRNVATRALDGVSVVPRASRTEFDKGLDDFIQEARRLESFRHVPGVVQVLSFARDHNSGYLVMELLVGTTLQVVLDREGGRLAFDRALALLDPVMDALEQLHDERMLHRDISPDNIFVCHDGTIKLIDFGAARRKMTERGGASAIVKDSYAPIEQYSSRGNQGPWTDVYALSATLYQMLTGLRIPTAVSRQQGDDLALPAAHLGIAVHPSVDDALARGLAMSVSNRFQTVAEFRTALQGARGWRADRPGGRRWTLAIWAGVAASGTLFVLWLLTRPPQIIGFSVAPQQVREGQATTVRWTTSGASRVYLSTEPGRSLPASGEMTILPSRVTSVHIVAESLLGRRVRESATVLVEEPPVNPPPARAVSKPVLERK